MSIVHLASKIWVAGHKYIGWRENLTSLIDGLRRMKTTLINEILPPLQPPETLDQEQILNLGKKWIRKTRRPTKLLTAQRS